MSTFQRENRYVVLKHKDLEKLPRHITDPLNGWLEENARRLPARQYVVIESDWPEYEVAFKLIEARVTGKPSEIDELRAALAKAEQERDALQSELDDWRFTNRIDGLQRSHDAMQAKITALEGQEPDIYVHNDGLGVWGAKANPELKDDPMYKGYYAAAGAAPTPMTQDRAEELAHRRCKRYIFIDDVPYQFDAHTLMDFVRDIEKAAAAPVPEGWLVAKQHVYQVREGDKKQLGYLVPEGMVVFPSFATASKFIAECELPLGWVCMKVSQLLSVANANAAPRSAS